MYGYGGKILKVDLTISKISTEETKKELITNYLGGDGFGVKLLYENFKPETQALSLENILVISPGLFTGTPVPTAGKTGFYSKSPLTNAFAQSMLGALGYELKYACYDSLIIKGKSEKPCYLWVNDDNIEIKNAEHIWGKDTRETAELIKKEADPKATVACIGIGGENLVKFACVCCEERQAGRTGMGAVMGSKNLKAIAVRGTKGLEIAEPDKLKSLAEIFLKKILEHPSYKEDTLYGTGEFLEWVNNERGTLPTRNWQASIFEGSKTISPYYWAPKYSKKNKACFSCIKPCGKLFVIEEGGYKGTVVDGPEYETQYALGSQCGNDDIEILAKANELCDLYGIDTISCGVVIGFAMELFEKGIISEKEAGLKLTFDNHEAILTIIEKIANREGIGNVLAEGVRIAAQKIGKNAESYALHVKGLEPPAYDVRGLKGMGLGFATSPRGACHLRSGFYGVELTGKWWKFKDINRFSTDKKGESVKIAEDLMSLYDAVGLCKFSRHIFFLEEIPQFIEAVTGLKFSNDELLKVGERINNIKRLFNLREGLTRKDDTLPKRVFTPILEGKSKGSYIKKEELDKMLDDYYEARGWDKEGIPTKEKLKELGL
ncbi:MAG: aldehyde ferredoxin oxidoreductase family protein [Candidatus Thermoplasmatota archaeon]|nr:aldehyde ferredoxin oxidoreductase family protein [Candidatus Thermoplasmatota archaeon]